MKKILIDVNSIILRQGKTHLSGIGRSTLDLLTALAKLKKIPFQILLFYQGSNFKALESYNLPFPVLYIPLPSSSKYVKLISQLRLKELLSCYDLLHIPHNYSAVAKPEKTLVTIHDAMFFSYPESFLGHTSAKKNYPVLAKACKGIITCSVSSKRDIVQYMPVSEDKVTVAHWGVSKELFYPETDDQIASVKEKYQLRRPFFIMVSCDIGRKNTISLLRAFRLYKEKGGKYDLVLVWGNPPIDYLDEFADLINEKRVFFLKHLSEVDLRGLYSGAIASFFPSKYEGFGLPVLESMACGTPVVTCRNSSLEEVGGKMAFYTEPDDLDMMAKYMINFESEKYDLLKMKQQLLNYSDDFSWEKTALAYVEFYKKHLGL
jgi:Glycosyltransferase